MLISGGRKIRFRGKRAVLIVLRNNGYCWGRVECPDGRRFDIDADEDHYDDEDDDAIDAFIEYAKDDKNIHPVL